MDLRLYGDVHQRVSRGELDTTRDELMSRLSATGQNPFAAAAQTSFTSSPQEVHAWLNNAASQLAARVEPSFLYVEMNGFSLNYDRWFCDSFGYSREVDHEDLDQLSDFEAELPSREALILKGMEAMQDAFRWWNEETDRRTVEEAETLADLLVQCRFLTLVSDAVAVGPLSPRVPVAAATHDSEIVLRFEPAAP